MQRGFSPCPCRHPCCIVQQHVVHAQDEYVSGALHHVVLGTGPNGPLAPDATYFYSCGGPSAGHEPRVLLPHAARHGARVLPLQVLPGP